MIKKCKHCGVEVHWVHWSLGPAWEHVSRNGDYLGRYCKLQTAEVDQPGDEGWGA